MLLPIHSKTRGFLAALRYQLYLLQINLNIPGLHKRQRCCQVTEAVHVVLGDEVGSYHCLIILPLILSWTVKGRSPSVLQGLPL